MPNTVLTVPFSLIKCNKNRALGTQITSRDGDKMRAVRTQSFNDKVLKGK
jgi:hypothetical protein